MLRKPVISLPRICNPNFKLLKQLTLLFSLVVQLPVLMPAQGTLIFDQQSSVVEDVFQNGTGVTIQQFTQYGQSFTPSLSAIDFVRLNLNDRNPNNSLGASLYINLRANTFSGPVVATTTSIALPDTFSGVVSFQFTNPQSLTPGSIYFLEPIVQTGDAWNILAGEYLYAGGSVYWNGLPSTASDFWFREGIIVPEPSAIVLLLFGGGTLLCYRRNCKA